MDFQNINKLVVTINLYSGNLLPMSDDNSGFFWGWKVYSFLLYIYEIVYMILTYSGFFLVPKLKSLQDGTLNGVVLLEAMILLTYMNCRRSVFKRMIKLINKILSDADEDKIQNCIKRTTGPTYKALKVFAMASISSVGIWAATPITNVLRKEQFSYVDFREPIYLPGKPFTRLTFTLGLLFETIGATFLIAKKTGIDAYIIHAMTVLTSEYHYISEQLENIFSQSQGEKKEKDRASFQKNLRTLIRHHSIVIQAGQLLKSLLALNVIVTYCNSIFRFCFVAFMVITAAPTAYADKCSVLTYCFGAMVQVYMICFCVQELLDASSSVTENAFYKQWYNSDLWSRQTFAKMMISNKLECRVSAYGTIDLTLDTYMTILKQSYSACLFLLKASV